MTETDPIETGYAAVNGLELYYEVRGTGEPLVLLHGGVAGIVMFGPNLQALSRDRRVIAVELQGHGRTADTDRPMSYEAMADDVAALMRHLDVPQADVMGLSLGGGVALQTVFRHPQLVRRLVIVSAPCRRDGWYPEVRAGFDQMGPAAAEPMRESPLAQLYPDIDWGNLFAKLGALQRREYDWSAEVRAIVAPAMLVFADADAVRPAHIVEFFELLGGGQQDAGLDGSRRPVAQLAVLPGLTHYTIASAPAVTAAVTPFLNAPVP
ncbi:MAG: alpha/beta hydrolase [Candidatus Dormibacteraeota bacterium]|nr:alpha/beta hydrolase [Candidatus Dormibacteraeota bacterium]MBO0761872.1 alpha/beta hydrolase [Candidatus Dormibacteraeota bacterium]